MGNVVSMDWQRRGISKGGHNKWTSMTGQQGADTGILSLRLAQEGEWVRIVAISGGRGLHERLAGVGLRVGATIQVLRNPMDGKLLLGHEGARLYLGGGMAHKIQVVVIKGESE
jgi:ferrous iron transport protein A